MRLLLLFSLALLLPLGACETGPLSTLSPGTLLVQVRTTSGDPVAAVGVELLTETGLPIQIAATTGPDGDASITSIRPGLYRARIYPPAGYTVPASQANPVRVTIVQDETVTLSVTLAR